MGQQTTPPRKRRKMLVGIVTSAKMNKTRRVEITRLKKHKEYGKYLRQRTVCFVHDEENRAQEGDQVEIIQTRPLSKRKRWRLVRVLRTATAPSGSPTPPVPAQEG